MDKAKNKKLYNIEFLRFVFSVIIVYFHILHNNVFKWLGGAENATPFLNRLAEKSQYAGFAVECFFILAGYFLYKTYYKNPNLQVKKFVYDKIARLWPVLFFTLAIFVVFYYQPFMPNFFNILFLQCIGISKDFSGPTWYISPFFWVMVFYFVLLKCIENKKICNIIIGVITYFSYVFLVNRFFGRETVNGFISLGLLRALGGIGVGYLIAVCLESIKSMPSVKRFKPTKLQDFAISAVITVGEIGSLAMLIQHFFDFDNAYENHFVVVIAFSILLVCMVSAKGLISRICNNKLFGFLGKYSYSIYVMQQFSFLILRDYVWKSTDYILSHGLRCVLISVAVAVAIGVATYYLVEKPSAMLLKKFGNKLFAE